RLPRPPARLRSCWLINQRSDRALCSWWRTVRSGTTVFRAGHAVSGPPTGVSPRARGPCDPRRCRLLERGLRRVPGVPWSFAAGCRHRRRRRPDRLAADAAAEKPGARVPPGEPIAGSPALSFRGLGWASAAGVGHAVWITRIALADPARPARRGYFWVAI